MKKLYKTTLLLATTLVMILSIATNALAEESMRTYTADGIDYYRDTNFSENRMKKHGNVYIFYDEDDMVCGVALNRYKSTWFFEHIYYPDEDGEQEVVYDYEGDEYKIVIKNETYYKFNNEIYTAKTPFPITYYYKNDEIYEMETPYSKFAPGEFGFPMNYTPIAKRLAALALYGKYDTGRLPEPVEIMPTMTEGEKAWDHELSRYGDTVWSDWLEYCSDVVLVGNEECSWTPMETFIYELNDHLENRIKIVASHYNAKDEGVENFTDMPNRAGYTGLRNPENALKTAKGTFYQDYVYEYWKRTNQLYYDKYGLTIPAVEKFFEEEGLALYDGNAPSVTPTSTPAPDSSEKPTTAPDNTGSLTVSNNGEIIITVNGSTVSFSDERPFIDNNGRTQVPVRAVAEMLNCDVNWDSTTSTAVITHDDGKIIEITNGKDTMQVNGSVVKMDTVASVINGRTYIPVRFVAEALGMAVEFVETIQSENKTVNQPKEIPLSLFRALEDKFMINVSIDGDILVLENGDTVGRMRFGSNTAKIDGEIVTYDAAPTSRIDMFCIPIAFLSDVYNIDINWDLENDTLTIITADGEKYTGNCACYEYDRLKKILSK